ncbi:MAG TPA: helix-turn-helix domain-containing protein [Phycisphaerae bacterium]|nr:helix-turn-helix domain-containing protein [Phycisphaerae bacterium]
MKNRLFQPPTPQPPAGSFVPTPEPPIDLSTWLTLKEVAAMLQYKNTTSITTLIRKGKLRGVNRSFSDRPSWLVDPESVQALIRSKLEGGTMPSPRVQIPPPPRTGLPPSIKRFV